MLRYALIFAVLAILAGVFGYGGISGDLAAVAKVLLYVFIALFVISLLFGRRGSGV
jgi:uncharacterized membrane protein YtjA (UPF0391 family)